MTSFKEFIAEQNPNSPFHWDSSEDEDFARTMNSAIKFSDGFYKSEKQAKFFNTRRYTRLDRRTNKEDLKNFFNAVIDADKGQHAFTIGGTMSWADYGTKGFRPVTWVFVMDEFGVVRKYKLKYVGDMRSGTAPDPSKTKLEWERPASAKRPEWASEENLAASKAAEEKKAAEDAARRAKMKFAGNKGEQISNIPVTVKKIINRGEGPYGIEYLTIFTTEDGDLIYWNNRPRDAEEGDRVVIKKTRVKDEITTKAGDPAIVITRPTFAK